MSASVRTGAKWRATSSRNPTATRSGLRFIENPALTRATALNGTRLNGDRYRPRPLLPKTKIGSGLKTTSVVCSTRAPPSLSLLFFSLCVYPHSGLCILPLLSVAASVCCAPGLWTKFSVPSAFEKSTKFHFQTKWAQHGPSL